MKATPKKFMALALCTLMLMGSFGGISEAHYHQHHHRNDAPPPSQQDEGHSGGEVSTAAIVGAVVGAVIAKVT
jgi:hypothetical protein